MERGHLIPVHAMWTPYTDSCNVDTWGRTCGNGGWRTPRTIHALPYKHACKEDIWGPAWACVNDGRKAP
eukprot:1160364-Pelagomonas_calceolata.AAC.6